jgi:Tol biopolymer transport system component
LDEICQAALDREPRERNAFVAVACGGDEELRREVRALLAHTTQADQLFDVPLGAVVAHLLGDTDASIIGTRIGAYEVLALIGKGGMGEVYRARDAELGRDVAIKILSSAFVADRDRLARFEHEARVLAALNHPNIGAIYGIERLDESRVLVLELVEGATLAERIASQPAGIPVGDALAIARQIAAALEAAHGKGIVHCDLKPANIKIAPGGLVKVLDFGLATRDTHADTTSSPALSALTAAPGVLFGTAGYMSPEQARGEAVDKRSDIWAFGCVLFEMLTGRMAFGGATASEQIGAVIEREPDWTALPASTPATARRLLRRCLEKNPNRRLHDIADARIEIEEAEQGEESSFPTAPPAGHSKRMWIGALAIAIGAGVTAVGLTRQTPVAEPIRFTLAESEAQRLPDVTGILRVSPDGRRVAFVSGETTDTMVLNVRSLDSLTTHVVSGTRSALGPFWSPDSRSIGFVSRPAYTLKTMAADGGPSVTVADAADGDPVWGSQGLILFERVRSGIISGRGVEDPRLFVVPAAGGRPVPATELDTSRGEVGHVYPAFLPDGRRFLFTALNKTPSESALYLASLDSRERTLLTRLTSRAEYASGYVLYQREGTLLAQRLDEKNKRLVGDAVRIVDDVQTGFEGDASFSVSQTGVLVYRSGNRVSNALTWFDVNGTALGTVGDIGEYDYPALSPNARTVTYARFIDGAGFSLWQLDLARNLSARFTTLPERDFHPIVWSPDGTRVVFASNPSGSANFDLYQRNADGSNREELLYASPRLKFPNGFSPDGRILLFTESERPGGNRLDIWALRLVDRKAFPVVQTPFDDMEAIFSPDGRWIAYQTNDSGAMQVVAEPFPPTGAVVRLSNGSGMAPVWCGNGEVFYATADQHIMSVAVDTGGGVLRPGIPRELFAQRYAGGAGNRFTADCTTRRFLLPVATAKPTSRLISVIVNWPSLLPRKD